MKLDWKSCLRLAASAFLLFLAIHYWPAAAGLAGTLVEAAWPLLVGGIIAYLVNIPMTALEKHYFPASESALVRRTRRPVCLLLAVLLLFAVVALILLLVLPQLADCVRLIVSLLPGALNTVVDRAAEWGLFSEEIMLQLQNIDWKSIVQAVTSGFGSAMETLISAVGVVFSGVVTAVMAAIFALYLLLGKDTLAAQIGRVARRWVPAKQRVKCAYVLRVFEDCMHRYVVGQCTEAIILGALCTGGMLLLQMPYATMIGALIAFTALIPIAGAYIGAGVGAFMIFTVSPMKALGFLVFIVVLQQLEGNLIYPRVVGSSIGIPGIWVLAAVTVGGGIAGVTGMLLGVPIAAAVYRLVQNELRGETPLELPRTGDES